MTTTTLCGLRELLEAKRYSEVIDATESDGDVDDVERLVCRVRALQLLARVDDALASIERASATLQCDSEVLFWRLVCLCTLARWHDAAALRLRTTTTMTTTTDDDVVNVNDIGCQLMSVLILFHTKRLDEAAQRIASAERVWPSSVVAASQNPHKALWVFFHLIRIALPSLLSLPRPLNERDDSLPRWFVFGDSHIVAQSHRRLRVRDRVGERAIERVVELEPLLVRSLEAWHLSARCAPMPQRVCAERHVRRLVRAHDTVLVVCGEIDTRQGSGIDRATKSGHYADEAAATLATASDFVDWLHANVRCRRCIVEAVRPCRLGARVGRCQQIRARIRAFNSAVAQRIAALEQPHVLEALSLPALETDDGFLDRRFWATGIENDAFHMNELCIEALQEALD